MTGTYSLGLTWLSLALAVATSYVAFALASRIAETRGRESTYWLAGGAVVLGTGIWSMHFVGMLARRLPVAVPYALDATGVSLLIAILVAAFALHAVSRPRLGISTLAAGALAMGVGIALMHYVGMAAMRVTPAATYAIPLVAASIAIATVVSAVALVVVFKLRDGSRGKAMLQRLLGALAIGAGLSAAHYTGMAAARFAPGSISAASALPVDQDWLAAVIAAAVFLLLGATAVVLAIDVRRVRQLNAANTRIASLAREDGLTGLANRRTFLEHLDAAFYSRARSRAEFAVLVLDLDGFKDVNDTLGHLAGDALIVEVAKRLKATVRRDDLVARVGGDEFAILQRNIDGPADAGTLAERLGRAVAEVYPIGHDEVAVTSSIGIAQVTETTSSPAELMVQADLALYRAKDDGRNTYRFHDSALDSQVHLRTMLARELQTAVERGELELLYRPQVEIASGRIVGLETHLQWNHPSRGIINADVFLPIAERTGMICAIAGWAFEEACAQLRRWADNGVAPPIVAVDVFSAQLKVAGETATGLRSHLDKYGIAADCIELQLDETALAQAVLRQPDLLAALRAEGFRVAIADFGMGQSSMRALAEAQVQHLKIPHAIVSEALGNEACARAVRTIVNIAREIGAGVVGGGVETQAQAMFLLAAGCEDADGPFFAPLLTPMEASLFLREAVLGREAAGKRKPSAA